MAIIVVVQEGVDAELDTNDTQNTVVDIVNTVPIVSTTSTQVAVPIEVLTGQPGVQNLFVGTTPPAFPQEGFVWIDTS